MHVLLFHHLKCWESLHSYVYTWINVGKNVEKREPIYFWWECKLAQETSNCQHLLDHQKSKRVSKKHLFLLYRLCQSLYVDHNKLWKILKEMGIPDHLTCLLRNLYAGQEAIVRIRHGTIDWFQIRKGMHQSCMLSLCLLNLYAEYIMWNAGLDEAQPVIKISGRNINNLICRWHHPYCRKQKRTKEPLDECERGDFKKLV